jgi:chromosome segregation ATPase
VSDEQDRTMDLSNMLQAKSAQIEKLELQNRELLSEVKRLAGVADRANKAMEKYQKHNGALEIAVQEAHRDLDAAKLRVQELQQAVDAIAPYCKEKYGIDEEAVAAIRKVSSR